MINVGDKLFVGDGSDCFREDRSNWVVIHACKSPCHQRALGYKRNLNKNHPNYLIFEKGPHLFLNMVDMDMPLSHEFTKPIISKVLDFIDKNIESNSVLIHCNQGYSRSPALALLFLAKRKGVISNKLYQEAKNDFLKIFPQYLPGRGIDIYLNQFWDELS
jgi:hypothetical protein